MIFFIFHYHQKCLVHPVFLTQMANNTWNESSTHLPCNRLLMQQHNILSNIKMFLITSKLSKNTILAENILLFVILGFVHIKYKINEFPKRYAFPYVRMFWSSYMLSGVNVFNIYKSKSLWKSKVVCILSVGHSATIWKNSSDFYHPIIYSSKN